MGKVTSSLKLDDEIFKKFKIKCIQKDLQISQAMDEAMKDWLVKK